MLVKQVNSLRNTCNKDGAKEQIREIFEVDLVSLNPQRGAAEGNYLHLATVLPGRVQWKRKAALPQQTGFTSLIQLIFTTLTQALEM